ncbi:MAG: antitoxin VapB family protein [Candidatus Micrarchaeaceae archaeon]|jgi:predicted CopG family antitoxin
MVKMVSLSELAYSKLSQKKGKNMSFSDVILQLLDENKGKVDISEFAGILKNKSKELDKIKVKVLKERRRNLGRKIG